MLEKLLFPSDFHKRIITLNFRDKRNLILAVFGLRKKSVKFGQIKTRMMITQGGFGSLKHFQSKT